MTPEVPMTHSLDDKLVEKVARAIHIARYGGRKPEPMCDTDWEYCERLGRAALEAAGVAELREEIERLRKFAVWVSRRPQPTTE